MEAAVEFLLQYVKSQRLIKDYTYLASAALLIYDYLLTIYFEVRLVWFSPWTYSKVLFLLTRYIPMANLYLNLNDQLTINATSTGTCSLTSVNASLLTAGIISAETIFMIRTWAVWRRDWRIGLFLVTILVGGILSSSINVGQFSTSLKPAPSPYQGFRGCLFSGDGKSLVQTFTTLAVTDAIVLGLMIISAFQSYISGNNSELSNIVHRDAILFYVYMLVCSVGSAIVAHGWPNMLGVMFAPLQGTLHSILACRVVFNIRSVAVRAQTGAIIGLHSDYREMGIGPSESPVDEDFDSDVILTTRVDRSFRTTSYYIS